MFKWYYLVQFSFWVQQILVIHMEARRKDHAQMLTHHVITCTLIFVTYVYRYYRVANVVLCLMDVVDFLLPVSINIYWFSFLSSVLADLYAAPYSMMLICTPSSRLQRFSAISDTKWPAISLSVCLSSHGSLLAMFCTSNFAGRSMSTFQLLIPCSMVVILVLRMHYYPRSLRTLIASGICFGRLEI